MSKPDPITLEIIQNSLQAAADEMFVAMKKTAMSSIIYEVLDICLLYTSPSPRDKRQSRMPSSA